MPKYDFSVNESDTEIEKTTVSKTARQNVRPKNGGFWKTMPALISTAIVLLTIALIWTDIRIADLLTIRFAGDLLAFLLLFYMMFFTCQDAGNKNGKRDPDYTAVQEEYRKQRNKIRNEGAELDIPEFCEFYVRKELKDFRSRILLNANIRYDDWEKEYVDLDELVMLVPLKSKKFEKALRGDTISNENMIKLRAIRRLSPRKRSAIIKACLVKPLEINPDLMMLDDGEEPSRMPISEKSIKKKQVQKDVIALCRITVMMFCSISLAGDFLIDMSISTLIFGLVKLVSLIITGYNGYSTGFTIYTEYGVRRLNDQINLFAVFWKWRTDVFGKPLKNVGSQEIK